MCSLSVLDLWFPGDFDGICDTDDFGASGISGPATGLCCLWLREERTASTPEKLELKKTQTMAQSLNPARSSKKCNSYQLMAKHWNTIEMKPTKSIWTDRNMCRICSWCLSTSRIASVGSAFCHRKLLFWCTESLLERLHLGRGSGGALLGAFDEASWSRFWKIDILNPIKYPLKNNLIPQELIHEHLQNTSEPISISRYIYIYTYIWWVCLKITCLAWDVARGVFRASLFK